MTAFMWLTYRNCRSSMMSRGGPGMRFVDGDPCARCMCAVFSWSIAATSAKREKRSASHRNLQRTSGWKPGFQWVLEARHLRPGRCACIPSVGTEVAFDAAGDIFDRESDSRSIDAVHECLSGRHDCPCALVRRHRRTRPCASVSRVPRPHEQAQRMYRKSSASAVVASVFTFS